MNRATKSGVPDEDLQTKGVGIDGAAKRNVMRNVTYPWTRFWCPRGDTIQVEHHGYLIDPESELGRYGNQHLAPLDALLTMRCLVLLGEAGIGKSTELGSLVNADGDTGASTTLHIDLGEYGSEETLTAAVFSCQRFRDWLDGADSLSIFLDGLDEALLEIPKVKSVLERGLRGAPTERLQLRIACRTAAWPETLTNSLEALFGGDAVTLHELAPLRRDDVLVAAGMEGFDAEAFVSQVEARGVGPLATNPTTLRFLLGLFRERKELPNSLASLYGRGLRALCTPSESRRERSRAPALSVPQVLQVATRIAALSVLTGRPIVYSSPATDARETDLAESEIVGGSERADASEFDVTPEAVRTTLRETGLFTSRGPHKLGFAHKTYGEYLAARYLCNVRLPAAQLGSLLFVPGEDPPRLIPQLHEVAAWLASFDREFFDRVAQAEPEVLLQSDVTARDQGTKALLIQSLLGRVERRELSWSQVHGLRAYLHRLRHEALAEQLRTAATDVDRRSETRRLAIEIADATDLKEMADVLADLALDPSADHGLRETAAYAVVSLEVESACERMKPLALGEAGDDPRDQLRGCGLRATWPRFLTVDDLLRCLTPVKQSNFTGAYQMFLHSAAIAERIADADLAQALEWAIGPGSHGRSHEPLSRLAGQLAYRALSHLDNESVRRALAKLIMRRLKAHIHDIFVDPRERRRLGGNEQQPLKLETGLRRLLLDALVTHSAINDLIYLIYCGFDFASPDDIEWMLHRVAETEADERAKWVRLAGFIFRPFQPNHLEIWQRHKDTCDAVRAMLPWPEVVVLESPEALEMRRRYTERKDHWRRMEELAARQERLDPPARERVRIVLNRCLSGEPELFWSLLQQLRLKDDDRDEVGLPETVQDHPGWQTADDETRSQIVEAARRYLRDAALDPADPYQRDIQYIVDMAPPLAVELLLNEDHAFLAALDSIRWELIAPFLLIAPAGNGETRRRAAEQAYRHTPDALCDAAVALIERSGSTADWQLVDMLEECLDDNLASRVLEFLRREVCSPASFRLLLGWLVRHEFDEARVFAESLLAPPRFGTDQVPRLCAEAAIVLIVCAPGAAWDTLWPPLEQNTDLARHVLCQVAHDFDWRSGTVAKKLSEQQLGQLAEWLLTYYPPTSDPVFGGVHAVGPDESVRDWRDALISHLADRGTPAACTAIQTLRDAHPELPWLHDRLLEAQRTRRRMSWMPPSPSELRMLVQDSSLRYVSTAIQLLDLVMESIDRYAEELHGTTPSVRNL